MRKLFFLLIISMPALYSHAQKINFYKEEITFQLDRQSFQVSGDYYFRNETKSDISQFIFYPVYKDSLNPAFDTIWIFDYANNRALSFLNKSDTGVFFHVKIRAGDSAQIKIYYRQQYKGNYVKYILTSTKTWEKPLESASYFVMADNDMGITAFAYPPKETIPFDKKTLYQWHLTNFMPDRDFEIQFKQR